MIFSGDLHKISIKINLLQELIQLEKYQKIQISLEKF